MSPLIPGIPVDILVDKIRSLFSSNDDVTRQTALSGTNTPPNSAAVRRGLELHSENPVEVNVEQYTPIVPIASAARISPEIWDYIISISSLRDAPHAVHWNTCTIDYLFLAKTSLVCRSWLPRSRYHLFEDVLVNPRNAKAFVELLASPTPTILPYIRKLRLVEGIGERYYGQTPWLKHVLAQFATLTAVERLWIACADFGSYNTTELVNFFSRFKLLKELQLQRCDMQKTSRLCRHRRCMQESWKSSPRLGYMGTHRNYSNHIL